MKVQPTIPVFQAILRNSIHDIQKGEEITLAIFCGKAILHDDLYKRNKRIVPRTMYEYTDLVRCKRDLVG